MLKHTLSAEFSILNSHLSHYYADMPHGQRVADLLLNIGAVKLSLDPPFTWTSGIKSPIYCDNRMLYSHPEARSLVVNFLAERVKNLHIEADVIAGTATAAIGWAALVANKLDLPFVYVRAKPKEHGAKKRIEGDLRPDKHVVVVEDLISTAGSSISTAEALREEGKAIVTDVVAIFSYELLSGVENAQAGNVKLHPLSNLSTLLKAAVERGDIGEEDMGKIAEFAKDPAEWGKIMGY